MQAPAYVQELMTGILKDFNFVNAYVDNITIFSRTAKEHFIHIKQVFEKLRPAHQGNTVPRTHPQHQRHLSTTIKNSSNQKHASTKDVQTSTCISWTSWIP